MGLKMWPTDSDGLDQQINEAARVLTDGSPGADFKARVLARIDEQSEGPARTRHHGPIRNLGGTWSQSRFVLIGTSVAVTTAAIVIAIVLRPSSPAPAPVVSSFATGEARAEARRPAAPIAAAVTPSPRLVARPSQAMELLQTEAATPTDIGPEAASPDLAVDLAPLQPAPIDIASLQVDVTPQPTPIVVEDLSVQSIHVFALDALEVFNQ